MGDDALDTSLSERVRSLEEEQRALVRLLEIVVSAPGDPRIPPRARHAKPKRPRPPGWRVITGGMAAFAPLAWHSPVPIVSAVAARHVWVSRRAQSAVAALLLGVAVIGATPAVADDGPDQDAACVVCASGEGYAGPVLRSPPGLPWRSMASDVRRVVP